MKPKRHPLTVSIFNALPDSEKEAIYEECERIGPGAGRPLTAAQRKAWRAAKRRMGRPRVGLGAVKIRVSVERGLLRQTDQFAQGSGLTRSAIIARGLHAVLRGAA